MAEIYSRLDEIYKFNNLLAASTFKISNVFNMFVIFTTTDRINIAPFFLGFETENQAQN